MHSRTWLWFLVGSGVLAQATLNVVRPITTYKLLALGADGVAVGLVTGAYAILPLLLALFLGRLVDRVNRLLLLTQASMLLLALGALIVAATDSVAVIVLGTVLLGIGHLLFSITGQAAISRYSADADLDFGFGWFTASFSIGQAVGPPLGGFFVGSGPVTEPGRIAAVNAALVVGAILATLAVPLFVVMRRRMPVPVRLPVAKADLSLSVPAHRMLRQPGVGSAILAATALMAAMDILSAFLPLVGERVGVSPIAVGWLLSVRGAAAFVSRVMLPALTRRVHRDQLLVASVFGAGLAIALGTYLIASVWLSLCLFAIGGFLLGLGQPLTMTSISTRVPNAWRSQALTLRLVGNRVGQVGVPIVGGFLVAPMGPAGAIWFTCVLLMASGVEQLLFNSRTRP